MADVAELTTLERAIARAMSGQLPTQALLWVLAASEVMVPAEDDAYDGDAATLHPRLAQRPGATVLPVFTAPATLQAAGADASFVAVVPGRQLLIRMPVDVGIVVNPGSERGFEVPSPGIAQIVAELTQVW